MFELDERFFFNKRERIFELWKSTVCPRRHNLSLENGSQDLLQTCGMCRRHILFILIFLIILQGIIYIKLF